MKAQAGHLGISEGEYMSTTTTPRPEFRTTRNSPLGLGLWRSSSGWSAMPLAHGVLPWALSWLAPRYGWTAGYPGSWNWLGLIPIAAGTAVLIWR